MLSPDIPGPEYVALDPIAFAREALALPQAGHFAVAGHGRLGKRLTGIARTQEVPFIELDKDEWSVVFGCRLDDRARQDVLDFLQAVQADFERRGVHTIDNWWLYSNERLLVACWDWQLDGGPIVVDQSVRRWMENLIVERIVRLQE